LKPATKLKKQLKQTQDLATKALKDKPKERPAKGYRYLKDIEPGEIFSTDTFTGVLIECNTNAKVIIVESNTMSLGRTIIGAETEIFEN
jgi:hypothetical protein